MFVCFISPESPVRASLLHKPLFSSCAVIPGHRVAKGFQIAWQLIISKGDSNFSVQIRAQRLIPVNLINSATTFMLLMLHQ